MGRHVALAALMDLLLGLSLGLYYTITYYGRALVPLPGFVPLGAPLLYYVGVDEQSSTVVQAWLWMLAFPVAGALWRLSLALAPLALKVPRLSLARFSGRLWHVCWPLLVPMPLLIWLVGCPSGQWNWSDYLAVCLRRHHVADPGWLTPVMMALALVALALELRAIRKLFAGTKLLRVVVVLVVAFMAYLIAVAVVGFAQLAILEHLIQP